MTIRLIRSTPSVWRVRDCLTDSDVEWHEKAFFRSKDDAEWLSKKAEQIYERPFVVKKYFLEAEDGGK